MKTLTIEIPDEAAAMLRRLEPVARTLSMHPTGDTSVPLTDGQAITLCIVTTHSFLVEAPAEIERFRRVLAGERAH